MLAFYWQQIDPTDAGGQFTDRGDDYRTAIFVHDLEQKQLAESSKEALANSGQFTKPKVTKIISAQPFYLVEENINNTTKRIPVITIFNDFLEREMIRLEAYIKTISIEIDDPTEKLNELFRNTLKEVWQ